VLPNINISENFKERKKKKSKEKLNWILIELKTVRQI
jgi:hypothetical protein